MSKKRKKSIPVTMSATDRPMVIDMNKMNLKKQHEAVSFRTGGHLTVKDRPRKKNWKQEYERTKDSYRSYADGSFLIYPKPRTLKILANESRIQYIDGILFSV